MAKLITISPYLQGALQGAVIYMRLPGLEGSYLVTSLQPRSLTHDSMASEFLLQHWIVFSWSINEYRF